MLRDVAECQADISLGIMNMKQERAVEWVPALCLPEKATFFYVIRQNLSSPDAVLTVINSR